MSVTAETQEIFMPSRHCLKNEMFLKEIIHNTSFIKNNPLISLRLATFVMFWIVAQSTSDTNIIQFLNICPSFPSIWRVTNTVASIWRKKYVSIFVFGHYLFFESHNCLLHQANYLRGQISLNVFMLKSTKYCLGVGLKVNSWPVFGGQSGQFPWILNGPSQNQVALDFL